MNTIMTRIVLLATSLVLGASGAFAASGTWSTNASGTWSDTTKWLAATVADGASYTGDFSTVDITAGRIVTLNTSRVIGHLRFADAITNSSDWTLASSGGSVLTLDAGAGWPTYTITNRTVSNNCPLAGAQGYAKQGIGTLVMNSANTYSGITTNRGGGELRASAMPAFGNSSTLVLIGDANGAGGTRGSKLGMNGLLLSNSVSVIMTSTTAGDLRSTIYTTAGSNVVDGLLTLEGSGTCQFNCNNAAHTLVLNGNVTNTPGFTGVMFVRGNGPLIINSPNIDLGSGRFAKTDGNVVTLTAAGHTWADTQIANGTVRLGITDALPATRYFNMGQNGTDVPILDLAGFNQTLDSLGVYATETGTLYIGNSSLTSDSVLTYASPSNAIFRNASGTAVGVLNDRVAAVGARTLGLTVTGGGSLTLTSTNTYRGPTTIQGSGSRLTVSAGQTGGGSFWQDDLTTLGVTVPNAGTTLRMSSWTISSASEITNNLALPGGNAIAPALYATNLNVSGTVYVNVSGAGLVPGRFPLIRYATASGLGDGTFVASQLPAGVLGYLSNSTATLAIDLVVTQSSYLVWQGRTNGVDVTTWDIGTTPDWLDVLTAAAAVYTDGQTVLFDDTAPGTTLVVPAAAVSPAGVIVSNATRDYTFAGAAIAGAGGFVKRGPAVASMAIANTYTGDTVVGEGTLRLAGSGVIPDGAGKGSVVVDGILDLGGQSETINGLSGGGTVSNNSLGPATLTLGGNNAGGTFTGNLQSGGIGLMSLTKAGNGIQAMQGNNTFTGALMVSGGVLELGGPGTPSGAISLGGGLRLYDGLTNSGGFGLTANSTLEIDAGAVGQFSSFTGGAFNLVKTGGGTLILTNGAATLASLHTRAGTTIADNLTISNTAYDSIGQLTNDNGTLIARGNATLVNNADFNVGDTANAVGRAFVQDNARLLLRNFWAGKGDTSQGFVYQTGGAVSNAITATADWQIGGNAATASRAVGGYYLSGGTFDVARNFHIGAYGYGEMVISGGVASAAANSPVVGRYGGSTGRLEVVGGTFRQPSTGVNLIIGEAGTGWLVVSNGGLVVCTNTLQVGSVNAGTGTATVLLGPGGRIVAPGVGERTVGAISTFNFDGGGLQATTNNAAYMQGMDAANVLAGGAVIDSAGWNIAIAQPLLNGGGGGGLAKTGAGTLTLSGANTYSGPTVVSQGTLRVTSLQTGGGSVTVEDGATFGASVATAGTSFAASSLTLGTAGATTLELGLGAYASPTSGVISAGALTPNGSPTLAVGGVIPLGVSRLIDYGTIGGGALALAPLPLGVQGELTNNTTDTAIDLNITNLVPLLWGGYIGSNWDINATLNWNFQSVPDVFTDSSYVRIDDSAYGSGFVGPYIGIVSNVSPGGTVVSNEVNPYVLIGAGGIAGSGGFLKQGAATVVVATANSYLGDTRVEGGVLVVSNAAALGASPGGTWTIDGGTLDLAGVALNGRLNPVRIRGAGAGGVGAIVNSGASQLNGIRQLALDGDATVGAYVGGRWDVMSPNYDTAVDLNNFTLTKIGSGYVGLRQLIITNSGWISIQEGTGTFTRCIVDGPGAVTIGPAGQLQFENYTTNRFDKAIESTNGTLRTLGSGLAIGSTVLLAGNMTGNIEAVTLEITNTVSGPGTLVKIGSGTLRLAGANTFLGGVDLAAGTLRVEADAPLGAAAAPVTFTGAGTLNATNTFTIPATRPVALNAAATVQVDADAALTLAMGLTGSGSLNKTGAGDLILSGANTYAGTTTVSAGSLRLAGGDDRLPTSTVVRFAASGTLDVGSIQQTVAGLSFAAVNMTDIITGRTLTVNGGLDVNMGPSTGNTLLTVDMSGLERFVFDSPTNMFRIGPFGGNRPQTNFVTLARTNYIRAASFYFADAGLNNPNNATNFILLLGQENTVLAERMTMGNRPGVALAQFRSDVAAPSLYIRGTNGPTSALGTMILGSQDTFDNATTVSHFLDVSAGALDAQVSTLVVGRIILRFGRENAFFTMGAGTLVATNMTLGQHSSTSPTPSGLASGTFSLDGGLTQVRNLILADSLVAGGTANGTFVLSNGTLAAQSLLKGASAGAGTGTFTWVAGTLRNFDAATDLTVTNIPLDLVAGAPHFLETDGGRLADLYSAMTNSGDLVKAGAGTARLFASNTYAGATAVSNGTLLVMGALAGPGAVTVAPAGTLGGTGTIAGAVTADGTVSPGASLGTLSFQSTLAFNPSGTALMEINTSAAPSNDQAAVAGALTYGGALVVTNLGPAPALGHAFPLFTAGSFNGWFSSVTLPSLAGGLTWDTNKLQTTGILEVIASGVTAAGGGVRTFGLAGGMPTITFTGTVGATYVLQTATNLVPSTSVVWIGLSTSVVPPSGIVATNDPTATNRVRYYRTVAP